MNDEVVILYMREFRRLPNSNKNGYSKKKIYHDCVFNMHDGEMLFSYMTKYYEELSTTQSSVIKEVVTGDDYIKVLYHDGYGIEFFVEYVPVFKEPENEVKSIDLEIVKFKKNKIVASRSTRRYRLGSYKGDMGNIRNEIDIEDIKFKTESILNNILTNSWVDRYDEVKIKNLKFENIIDDDNPIGILMLHNKSDNSNVCFNLSIKIRGNEYECDKE